MKLAVFTDRTGLPIIPHFLGSKIAAMDVMTEKWQFLTKIVALNQQNANFLPVRGFKHRTAFPKK